MSKFIYYDKNLRCRIRKTKFFIGELELQLQKKSFLLWVNCFDWMIYEERQAARDGMFVGNNPMSMKYQFGNKYECWDNGTMTVYKRAEKLFEEYLNRNLEIEKWNKKFESI